MNKMNKKLAVAFTGPSNSGKTTLIVKLSNFLQELGFKVAIIKNDPKDKASFDTIGKDSFKFSQTGADVAVVSPNKTTIFKKESLSIEQIAASFNNFDFLLVEGLKNIPLPRICIHRDKDLDGIYFQVSDCIATNKDIKKYNTPKNIPILDLNNIEEIYNWIKNNAKEI